MSVAGVFVMGIVVQWGLLKPVFTRPPESRDDYATVVTLALLLFLRSVATGLAGPYQFTPGSNLPVIMVGPMPLAGARVAAFLFALAALGLFYVLLRYTWYGLALRATAQSRVGVQTAGIDVLAVDRIAFASAWRWPVSLARCWRRSFWSTRPTADHDHEGLRDRGDRRLGVDPRRAGRRPAARPDRILRRGLHRFVLPECLRFHSGAGDPGATSERAVRRAWSGA